MRVFYHKKNGTTKFEPLSVVPDIALEKLEVCALVISIYNLSQKSNELYGQFWRDLFLARHKLAQEREGQCQGNERQKDHGRRNIALNRRLSQNNEDHLSDEIRDP